jgi:hypothetical protein
MAEAAAERSAVESAVAPAAVISGWLEANDRCAAGCQSCVSTTCSKRAASRLSSGTTSSPRGNHEASARAETVLNVVDHQQDITNVDG